MSDQTYADHRFDLRHAGVQFGRDGWNRDADDERIDAGHELRGDDNCEHPPATR
jgi:hypothetical protein